MTFKSIGLRIVCFMLAALLLLPNVYSANAQKNDISLSDTGWITPSELIPPAPLLARTLDNKATSDKNDETFFVDENLTLRDELLTYEDPRFDFSISYPSSWQVNPRKDNKSTDTEVLSFAGPEKSGFTPAIYIGHYLIDIKDDTSLQDWVSRYPQALPIKVTLSNADEVDGHEAYLVSGESTATKLQYLSIKNGSMVWFVWANFNKSSDPKYNEVFEIMKASLRLGEDLPQRLQDIYGELFEPLPLPLGSLHVEQTDATRAMAVSSSQWDVPVYGNWTVNCGSPYHTNGASHSADIAAYQYTGVVAARGGSVLFSGWDNSGYGNLIKLDTSTVLRKF